MKYTTLNELPLTIQEVLPPQAQELYLQIYNEAMEMDLPESIPAQPHESMAHQLAWDAVTREFIHDEQTGQWYRQGEEPVLEVEEQRGLLQKLRGLFQPAGT